MPYASNDELPEAVRKRYSSRCQTVFREAFNSHDGSEESKFKVAHTAARNCMESTMNKAEGTIGGTPISKLPDSAFACVDSKGRHYPHHDANGKLDMAHLRNAMSRLAQEDTTSCGAAHLRAHAKSMGMGKEHEFLKAEQLSSSKWRVLAIPFGGPFEGKDLDGEFFSPRTDIKPDWFDRRPLVWHHNLDKSIPDPVLGTADDLEEQDDGWWTTVWLNRSNQYWAEVNKLLSAGKIYGSSGSLPNFVRTDRKTGEILVWPYIEQTLTPTPANPFSVVVAAKAIDHFAEADIDLSPALRDAWANPPSDLDLETADLRPDLRPEGDATDDATPDEDTISRLQREVARLEVLIKRL